MAKKKFDERALAAVVQDEIRQSRRYSRQTTDQQNDKPIQYYLGDIDEWIPHEEGRSSVVSRDVADTVGWIMPDLMRLFFSGDRAVDFLPGGPEDEEFTEQVADYINHVFLQECNGYNVFWDAAHDGLVLRNGIIKYWWDNTPEHEIRTFTGLDDAGFQEIINREELEVLEHSSEVQVIDLGTGPEEAAYHDIKVRITKSKGRIVLRSLPPEQFLIDRRATEIDDSRFMAHRYESTRSDLIEMGYTRDEIEKLPVGTTLELEEDRLAREEETETNVYSPRTDDAMEIIEVFECYTRYDYNDDGIAEWIKVVMAGGADGRNILEWEPWGDPTPFVDLNPERVPHRYEGRSIFDQTEDVQDVKTVLLRNTLDNLYDSTNPQKVVVDGEILDPDSLVSPRFGEVHRVQSNVDAIKSLQPTFVADSSFAMLGYWDQVVERRTGVTQQAKAMEPNRLQDQSATAAVLSQSASHSKVELIGRNYANDLKKLFKGMLRLTVTHQDREMTVRLRNKWVTVNPSMWNPSMDAIVNTGLGTGSRERDLAMLFKILEIQQTYMDQLGMGNPGVKPSQIHNTLERIIHASGMYDADMFFTEVPDDEWGKWWQQKQQQEQEAAQQPDPQTMAFVEVEKAKSEATAAKAQAESQQRIELAKVDAQKDSEKLMIEDKMKREEAGMSAYIEEMKVRANAAMTEAKIKYDAMAANVDVGSIDPIAPLRDIMSDLSRAVAQMQANAAAPRRIERGEDGSITGVTTEMEPFEAEEPGATLEQVVSQLAGAVGQMQAVMQAPKRVVRDPDTGRVVGVEPVLN